ncbi:uncharacterized protein LOC135146443 [Zophobas morio]|uniref:uncharacterized protein LOC135146443 n=1 Tax=Zophobas morio TaxID=2755281 RepID=UPI0030836E8A
MSAYSAYIASKRQSAKKNDRFLLHKKKIPRVMNCPQKKNSKIASEVNLNVESLPSESTLEQLKEVSKPNVSSEFTDSESKQEISDLQSVRPLFQETEILIDVQPMEVISEDLTNNQPQHPSKLSEGFVESGLPTKKSNLSDIEKGKGGIQNLQLGGPQNIISWCPSETCLCEIITGGVCITLYYLQHVSIIGSCILQVLHGCVIVDGYMLSCDGTLPVISSKSASLVTIKGWRNDRLNLTNETLLLKKDFLEVPLLNKVSELCKQNNDSNISVLLIKNSNFSIKEHLFDFSEVSIGIA